MSGLKILSVVSEAYPLAKTGGLGDVAGALPLALREQNIEMVTLLPGYPSAMAALRRAQEILAFDDLFGGPARVLSARVGEMPVFVIDAPHLFDRPGNPYVAPDGQEWSDNALRFGALGWVAARIGLGDVPSFVPDIVHCHDWQAGLTPAYLAYAGGRKVPTVVTIHNLAYQGKFPAELLSVLRLPGKAFQIDGVEYYGMIGFLKAGLQFADRITTVSPTYAMEIQTPANGFGLDGLLRARAGVLSGITNGIDTKVWNPQRDARIPMHFGRSDLSNRSANTAHLRRHFGLDEADGRPLLGVVSRLVWQKGLDLVAEAAKVFQELGTQLVVLGAGDKDIERSFSSLARAHRGRFACAIGYDEDIAHLIQAGSDALLVPSRFEPCGLTQLCALRYGAIPVVAKVGGLADTVTDVDDNARDPDGATGIHITQVTRDALELALRRVSHLWSDKKRWKKVQLNGMRTDVSWKTPAAHYARLYADLMAAKK